MPYIIEEEPFLKTSAITFRKIIILTIKMEKNTPNISGDPDNSFIYGNRKEVMMSLSTIINAIVQLYGKEDGYMLIDESIRFMQANESNYKTSMTMDIVDAYLINSKIKEEQEE